VAPLYFTVALNLIFENGRIVRKLPDASFLDPAVSE
jgi:hypothetical protein